MKNNLMVLVVGLLFPLAALDAGDETLAVVERPPRHHKREVLVSSEGLTDWRYLAFPALLDCGDEVLVSFKRGRAHAYDPGASLELVRISSAGEASAPQSKGTGTTRIGLHAVTCRSTKARLSAMATDFSSAPAATTTGSGCTSPTGRSKCFANAI